MLHFIRGDGLRSVGIEDIDVGLACDDDMAHHIHADKIKGMLGFSCREEVIAGRDRDTVGMVMRQNGDGCALKKCGLHELTHRDGRGIDGAFVDLDEIDHVEFIIEQKQDDGLNIDADVIVHEMAAHFIHIRKRLAAFVFLQKISSGKLGDHFDERCGMLFDAGNGDQVIKGCIKNTRDRTKPIDQAMRELIGISLRYRIK